MRSLLIGILLASVVACQTRKPKDQTKFPEMPPEETVPAPPAPTVWKKNSDAKVAVVLGPGGAKTFAHAGVLKTLIQNKVPINKVVGLEWAALVGGLYASKGQIHEVEWKIYKMEQKDWLPKKGFFGGGENGATIKSMDDFFKDSFGSLDIASFQVPFACPSRSLWTATMVMQTRGTARDIMKKCVPFPPIFRPQGFIGAPSNVRDVILGLRQEGYNVIILVDVLGNAMPVAQDALMDYSTHVILWQEVRRAMNEGKSLATDVIEVDTSAYPMVKFEARRDLVRLGETLGKSPVNSLVNKYGF